VSGELLVRALEALEDGDAGYAAELLRLALERGGRELLPHRCPGCGQRYRWPGELEGHLAGRSMGGGPRDGTPLSRGLAGTHVPMVVHRWGGQVSLAAGRAAGHGGRRVKPSQASLLVELVAADADLFRCPLGDAYAALSVDGHRETWPLRAKGFRRWLAWRFYEAFEQAPGGQALADAASVLEGRALFEGCERPVSTRVGGDDEVVYLDLADDDWRAVRVDDRRWETVSGPPVHFRRPRGMLPLPEPAEGGSLAALRDFVNVASEDDFVLLVAWLVAAIRPRGPYPVLVLIGEQGSAKSTTARVLRALIDPNEAGLRTQPRDEGDLIIAARNGQVIALDNLSALPNWLSDGICRVATGGGLGKRELYSDLDEVIVDVQRPVILNGIDELASRGDLLDRALIHTLPRIGERERRDERSFWRAFEAARPMLLGALLDAAVTGLARLDSVRLAQLPRMADFARWVSAAEPALPWQEGRFLAAYLANRARANDLALEGSLISPHLQTIAAGGFSGPLADLLLALGNEAGEALTRRKDWPQSSRALSGELRRIAPNLRAVGVEVLFGGRSKQGRLVTVVQGDGRVTVGDGGDGRVTVAQEQPSPVNPHGQAENGLW
jgi:hypothetical protein